MEVVCGTSALARNGLGSSWYDVIASTVSNKDFDRLELGRRLFFYKPTISAVTDYTTVITFRGEKLLLPSKERALLDCMQNTDITDEGQLCEAIVDYLEYPSNNGSREKLYEVADFFGYPRDKVDWWISEAYDYCSDM